MNQYNVTIPIYGHVVVTVDAEDEESAADKAFEEAGEFICSWTIGETPSAMLDSLECYDKVNSGNVCHLPSPWKIVVEEDK